MRFYQPLTLGIERRRVAVFAEDRQGAQRRPPAAWGEGVSSPTVEYEEHPAAEVLKILRQAPHGHRFWLIRGEPGAGKSTLLAHWFTTWARDIPAARLGMTVPVFVRLRELEPEDLKQEPAVLADRLWRRGARLAQAQLGQDAPPLYRLEGGRHFQPVWLLDGLDEVRPEWLNENLYEALAALPGLKLVSCRTAVYATLQEHADAYKETPRDYLLLGLKPPEQRSFLEQALEGDTGAAASLHDRLQAHAQLKLLAGNPLMLTLIAELADRLELPATRAAFYREAIARMWNRKPLPGQDIRYLSDVRDRLLIALAEKMGLMRLEENLAGLIESSRSVAGDDYQILLDALERTNLLVIDRHRETARFFHLTFQEYYLAQALQPQGLQSALQRHWDDARYEETLALLSAVLFEQGQVEEINRGIQWFINWGLQTHREHPQALWQRRRSPLRIALHLLSRSGMALSRLPEVHTALWLAIEKSRLRRMALAVDPETPPEVLVRLAADPDERVRWGGTRNPSLPPEALARLAAGPDEVVRWWVARNPSTPPEALARLAADPDDGVREGVTRNPTVILEDLGRQDRFWSRWLNRLYWALRT